MFPLSVSILLITGTIWLSINTPSSTDSPLPIEKPSYDSILPSKKSKAFLISKYPNQDHNHDQDDQDHKDDQDHGGKNDQL